MPDSMLRISDFVGNELQLSAFEVSELRNDAPFITGLPSVESSHGDQHKYIQEIGAPSVGFREPYKGRFFSRSQDQIATIDLKLLDFSWMIDQAVADTYPQGAAAAIAREGFRHLKEAFFVAEKQFFNGQAGVGWTDLDGGAAGIAGGFLGLADTFADLAADLANPFDLGNEGALDAGGSTDRSSIYFLRVGERDVAGLMRAGNPFVIKDSVTQNNTVGNDGASAAGADGGSNYPVYYTPGYTWMGVQVASRFSAMRLANVGSDTTVDDDLIYSVLAHFPASRKPNLIVMNQQKLEQLRSSRTATTATGASAPMPESVAGVPILVTDSIFNTETAVTAP